MKINEASKKTFGSLPEKAVMIGEGNFLRAFCCDVIDRMNEAGLFGGSVAICQPQSDSRRQLFYSQDCMYTVVYRGLESSCPVDKSRIITSVSRYLSIKNDYEDFLKLAEKESVRVVISNTTEAGIAYNSQDKASDFPPQSYPARLTAFLFRRYEAFSGDGDKGVLILPVELIERNGERLKSIVLRYADEWYSDKGFKEWIDKKCLFACTLVDRIVTGKPADSREFFERLGYEDGLLDVCEPYMFWGIEADSTAQEIFPADKLESGVIFCDDIEPYRMRKVRILNGAHTLSALAAFLCGRDTVYEMMNDEVICSFIKNAMFQEIIPTIDLPEKELSDFANATLERFSNPFVKHRLLDISLNSVSKFKTRNFGTLRDYLDKFGVVPERLAFSLAALIKFYDVKKSEDGHFYGERNGEKYEVRDSEENLEKAYGAHMRKNSAQAFLRELGFTEKNADGEKIEASVLKFYSLISEKGMYCALKEVEGL